MIPEAFLERMKNDLNDEYESFVKSYNQQPYNGARVNTLKLSRDEFLKTVSFCEESIPWCREGFYYGGKMGNHPSSVAGLFYSQEPSAMIAAQLLPVNKGDKVLDLCAAPGGKSTQIASKLLGEGLLVSNEIIASRAKILCDNIERMGIKNAVVTSMSPDKMEKLFTEFFDAVMVDAPCSGEGMFRKDPDAAREWSIEHTYSCANRQLSILESAYKMLSGGGNMVYSTCTFSKEENERVCEKFLASHSDMELLQMHRLMPHKVKGEGHFSALFRKNSKPAEHKYPSLKQADKKFIECYRNFEKENLNIQLDGEFVSFGNFLHLVPRQMISLDKIKCIRPGILLGEVKSNRFVPSHHLCMVLKKEDFKRTIALSDKEVSLYLKGSTIESGGEKGFGAMLYENCYPLGWYKQSDGVAKNHYPKHLRLV